MPWRARMFRKVDPSLLRPQNFITALRKVCDQLYREGVNNFIHEGDCEVYVTFFNPERKAYPIIDYVRGGILFRGENGEALASPI